MCLSVIVCVIVTTAVDLALSQALEHHTIPVPVPDTVAFLLLFGVFVVPAIPMREAGTLLPPTTDSKVRARGHSFEPGQSPCKGVQRVIVCWVGLGCLLLLFCKLIVYCTQQERNLIIVSEDDVPAVNRS